jgi:hypothetical protein
MKIKILRHKLDASSTEGKNKEHKYSQHNKYN